MKKSNSILIISILFLIVLSFITIGYAVSDTLIELSGVVKVLKPGKIEIKSITRTDDITDSNAFPIEAGELLKLDSEGNIELDFSFDLKKNEEHTYYATYLFEIYNNTFKDYTFTGFSLNPIVDTLINPSDGGVTIQYEYIENSGIDYLNLDDKSVIESKKTKYLEVKLIVYVGTKKDGNINVSGGVNVNYSKNETGQLLGTVISTNTLDLVNNSMDCFDFQVVNTFNYDKSFSIKSGKDNFYLVDTTGNLLSNFIVPKPSEDDELANIKVYTACIKAKENSLFPGSDSEQDVLTSTNIILESTDIFSYSIGNVKIRVPKTEENDTEKVHIGNVSFELLRYDESNDTLIAKTSWNRLPDYSTKSTDVKNYYLQLYDANNNRLVYTFVVDGAAAIDNYELHLNSSTYLNVNDMVVNNHNYYIKVYGIDEAGNSGADECFNNNDYCVSSNPISLKYRFNITLNSTANRVQFSSPVNYVYLNSPFQAQIQLKDSNSYVLGNTIEISMGNKLLSQEEYYYGLNSNSTSSGNINIYKNVINNDISITATATSKVPCLVEGTLIKLADGTYKKIEDIYYDDLLLAVSHITGHVIEEYPIWIEQKGTSDNYQITTFSDGTALKTVGSHGIYSVDDNEYVSVIDRSKFHIGTHVIKINNDNNLETVTVTNIETIYDKVNYYHVSSTYYHNVIANDLLTTDAILVVSNMFNFDKKLKWTSEREEFISKGDLFKYEDWSYLFPEHIFKGFRMEEAMILQKKNLLDISLFDEILNGKMMEPIKSLNGKNLWMISDSEGIDNKFYEEGSIYTFKEPYSDSKTFLYWYNTADNKYYKINDKIKIIYGMHFKAIWK